MSQLRSVLDQMAAVSDETLTVEELAADVVELSYVGQMVDVLVARKTKQISDRGGHLEMGYPSPTALLVDQARMSAGHAKQVVSRSNASVTAPVSFKAWADGWLSTDQTRYLFQLAESVPDVFPATEESLVAMIEPLSARQGAKVLEYWRQSVDGPGELDPEIEFARRGVSLSRTMGGMGRIDGWLTLAAREALASALEVLMPPPRPDDARTARQRRHDALEDLAWSWLDGGDTPVVGGEKPHISVIADIPALQRLAGGLHETLNRDILDVDTLRMLACDCSVSRIVIGPDAEVLDIGRKTRVWTAAQRRAIIAHDRHCQRATDARSGLSGAISTTSSTGRMEVEPAWRTESSSAGSITHSNTSRKAGSDDREPRGGPFPATPEIRPQNQLRILAPSPRTVLRHSGATSRKLSITREKE